MKRKIVGRYIVTDPRVCHVSHHRAFNTSGKRMGAVVRLMPTGLTVWRLHAEQELRLSWLD
jgi:hypothetical protein